MDALISPCMCKGTGQFVHRSCLDHWRSTKEYFAFSHCTTCRAQFHLRLEDIQDHMWLNIKFRFFVARDILFIFLMIQMGIAAIGALTFLIDRNGNFRNSFSDDWERILSKHPIPFYYSVGVIVFLVVVGSYGLFWQCTSSQSCDCGSSQCCDCGSSQCCDCGPSQCCDCGSSPCCDCGPSPCCDSETFPIILVVLVVVLVVVLAIIGLVYSLFVATMVIQHIWQKHYHILTMRKLTKEFIVEDLHGHYTHPKLDAKQEERLKKLNLL